jgi:phage gp46-like protein
MTDFALHRATGAVFDISTSADDIESDDGMYTAVLISIFCDAACALDELPAGEAFRGGYFGDTFEPAGDSVGSKLRLLDRERRSTYVLRRAESYARDALAWLVSDGVASAVSAVATFDEINMRMWHLTVTIIRPFGDSVDYRFGLVWGAHELDS